MLAAFFCVLSPWFFSAAIDRGNAPLPAWECAAFWLAPNLLASGRPQPNPFLPEPHKASFSDVPAGGFFPLSAAAPAPRRLPPPARSPSIHLMPRRSRPRARDAIGRSPWTAPMPQHCRQLPKGVRFWSETCAVQGWGEDATRVDLFGWKGGGLANLAIWLLTEKALAAAAVSSGMSFQHPVTLII